MGSPLKSILTTCFFAVILSLQIGMFSVAAEADEEKEKELNLYAQSAVLVDASSGRILYGKEENVQRPMASTTKIMTCILALEYGNPEDVVTVSSYAAGQPKVHLGVSAKQSFYLKDLLYSLMLESHNDTAVMIAEHIGGSVKGFAAMMNQKARDIGCEETYFITPNGLDAVELDENGVERIHSTTAEDLAKIMSYCAWKSPKKEEFLTITQTQNYYFSDVEKKRNYNCTNHNAFLTMMSGAISGKTGFTGGAGYSYISALEDQDRMFVVALLGCGWPPHKTYKWSDTRQLFTYGLEHYHYQDVFQEQPLKPLLVKDGISSQGDMGTEAYTALSLNLKQEEKNLNILMKEGEQVEISYEIVKELQAPVRSGTIVGHVSYHLGEEQVGAYPIYTADAVEKISWKWCFEQVFLLYCKA